MKIFEFILAIIFPEHCLSCGEKDTVLCSVCSNRLPRGFSPDQKTLVILDYSDRRVRKALWLFKYGNRRSLSRVFAELINSSLLEELAELRLVKNFTDPALIPMPIGPGRFRERGYSQTELIARELSKLLEGGATLRTDILIKSRDTPSQVKTASRRERLSNLRNSFYVPDKEAVRGQNIILLDDIVTTGATLAEARAVLKRAGAKQILSVAVAH
ncbi:MAG: phosphoribosyltransferase family protein [Candidatus Paceibacterota bacterium]|jgi:ComF family protein